MTAAFPAAAVWTSIGAGTIDTVVSGVFNEDSVGEIAVSAVISAGLGYVGGSWAVEVGVDKLMDKSVKTVKYVLKKNVNKAIKNDAFKTLAKAFCSFNSDLLISGAMAGSSIILSKGFVNYFETIAKTAK